MHTSPQTYLDDATLLLEVVEKVLPPRLWGGAHDTRLALIVDYEFTASKAQATRWANKLGAAMGREWELIEAS